MFSSCCCWLLDENYWHFPKFRKIFGQKTDGYFLQTTKPIRICLAEVSESVDAEKLRLSMFNVCLSQSASRQEMSRIHI